MHQRMNNEEQIYHQIWLKCMQMNQCNMQQAGHFVSKCVPYLNRHLTSTQQTLLMIACSIGSLPIVTHCLLSGSQINLIDSAGRSALHYCASIGNIQIFELLIQHGSNPLQVTIGGETPLTKACMFCQGDVVQWYLNHCLRGFQIRDRCGKRPLDVLRLTGEELYHEVKEVYDQLMQQ